VEKDTILDAILKKLSKAYSLVRYIGGGEYSNVYLVKLKETGAERALKILDYHYLLTRLKKQNPDSVKVKFEEIKRRFISEARLYKKIYHPNIVDIYETGTLAYPEEGIEIPYFFMSYIKGSSLADIMKERIPLEVDRVIKISSNVLEALEAMHRGKIIHRDIKSSNIMVREDSGEAVIIDFGIAKDIVGGTRLTTTGALLGSPAYMAPEQFIDSSQVGPALDIYSFGVVLFEMLTGDTPFKGNNFIEVMNAHRKHPVPQVSTINPSLPAGADLILARAMAKEPNHRYKTARDFLNSVKQIHAIKPRTSASKTWFQLFGSITAAVLALMFLKPATLDTSATKDGGREEVKTIDPVITKTIQPKITKIDKDYKTLKNFLTGDSIMKQKRNRCRRFLNTYRNKPKNRKHLDMIEDIETVLKQLNRQINDEKNYLQAIAEAKKHIADNNFAAASVAITKLKKLKGPDDPAVKQLQQALSTQKIAYDKQNGEVRYNNIKNVITLSSFLDFKKIYPKSIHIPDLKRRLLVADPRLPPETYWPRAIVKNKKGYYEIAFGADFNQHVMVYIPDRKLWIDKFEVSNAQFQRYLKYRKMTTPPNSTSNFIHNGATYPAVVHYAEADKYCSTYGFRLPRIADWEYVAGLRKNNYPWGNDEPDAGGIWRANFDTLEDGGEKDGFNGTAPVDSFQAFASPFGVVNMSGNVWEWVRGNILKGGSFFSTKNDLLINKNRGGRNNDREGFRCIKEENPGD
jgi:serine/threonine protein kinase